MLSCTAEPNTTGGAPDALGVGEGDVAGEDVVPGKEVGLAVEGLRALEHLVEEAPRGPQVHRERGRPMPHHLRGKWRREFDGKSGMPRGIKKVKLENEKKNASSSCGVCQKK